MRFIKESLDRNRERSIREGWEDERKENIWEMYREDWEEWSKV